MSETERAREVDAAWRAASREEPPTALDAAIRAEARRAVGARPGGAHRHRQWRYPAAAAATVALLAFGIAQMIPPEHIAPEIVAKKAAPRRQESASGERFAASPAPGAPDSGNVAATAPRNAAGASLPSPEARGDQAQRDVLAQAPKTEEQASAGSAYEPERPAPAMAASTNAPKRALAAAPVAVAEITNLDEAKAKQAGADSVEAWIARIRDLRNRGQLDAATRELATFRATYGERADALLPADLRENAAQPPRP